MVENIYNILSYLLDHWIAVAALLLSSFLAYRDYFQPFRPQIRSGGRICLLRDPFRRDPGLHRYCVKLDLIFSNAGAKQGIFEDVAVKLSSTNGRVLLSSQAVDTYRGLDLTKNPPSSTWQTFVAFISRRHDDRPMQMVFMPHESSGEFRFVVGEYRATILARTSKSGSWEEFTSLSFSVIASDIEHIEQEHNYNVINKRTDNINEQLDSLDPQ
ncbi:MAG: hypothetical protein IH886_11150 [Nitrospinae bacterium]|nr:hypothetical protein [Nitrospinota bacterium]